MGVSTSSTRRGARTAWTSRCCTTRAVPSATSGSNGTPTTSTPKPQGSPPDPTPAQSSASRGGGLRQRCLRLVALGREWPQPVGEALARAVNGVHFVAPLLEAAKEHWRSAGGPDIAAVLEPTGVL